MRSVLTSWLFLLLFSCEQNPRPPESEADSGTSLDAGIVETDAGFDAGAFPTDAGYPCGLAPLENAQNSGGTCTFNSDCPLSERCECDAGVCTCAVGARGKGCAGIDVCTDGNDCQSSLCVEGQSGYYCSAMCEDDTSCGPHLPLCRSIAFLGNICIRQP